MGDPTTAPLTHPTHRQSQAGGSFYSMTFDAPAISILLATAAAAMKGNVTPADLWGTAPDYAWSQLVSLIRAQNWSGLLDYLSSGPRTGFAGCNDVS